MKRYSSRNKYILVFSSIEDGNRFVVHVTFGPRRNRRGESPTHRDLIGYTHNWMIVWRQHWHARLGIDLLYIRPDCKFLITETTGEFHRITSGSVTGWIHDVSLQQIELENSLFEASQ
jgi:hypothetical protein